MDKENFHREPVATERIKTDLNNSNIDIERKLGNWALTENGDFFLQHRYGQRPVSTIAHRPARVTLSTAAPNDGRVGTVEPSGQRRRGKRARLAASLSRTPCDGVDFGGGCGGRRLVRRRSRCHQRYPLPDTAARRRWLQRRRPIALPLLRSAGRWGQFWHGHWSVAWFTGPISFSCHYRFVLLHRVWGPWTPEGFTWPSPRSNRLSLEKAELVFFKWQFSGYHYSWAEFGSNLVLIHLLVGSENYLQCFILFCIDFHHNLYGPCCNHPYSFLGILNIINLAIKSLLPCGSNKFRDRDLILTCTDDMWQMWQAATPRLRRRTVGGSRVRFDRRAALSSECDFYGWSTCRRYQDLVLAKFPVLYLRGFYVIVVF